MTSIFDGMSAIIAGALGGTVRYRPTTGPERDVPGLFREAPIEVEDATGNIVLIPAPTWRVAHNLVPELARGDQITTPDGRSWSVMNVQPGGSPAADANVVAELHRDPAG
ncbi:MAG: hypothetical protein R3E47_04750 [Paracoccaceae bacterium]